jgi:hypothetical protein
MRLSLSGEADDKGPVMIDEERFEISMEYPSWMLADSRLLELLLVLFAPFVSPDVELLEEVSRNDDRLCEAGECHGVLLAVLTAEVRGVEEDEDDDGVALLNAGKLNIATE